VQGNSRTTVLEIMIVPTDLEPRASEYFKVMW